MDGRAKIFEWVPGCLAWLNLHWGAEGVDHHMAEVRRASELLAADPGYWSAVIRDDNWRASLIGYTCLMVSRNRGFLDDLRYRFIRGSMVAPQIAVAIGLLHPAEATEFFRSATTLAAIGRDPRRVVSSQTVLTLLGVQSESEIRLTGWPSVDADYAVLADRVVRQHWKFWSSQK
jgi:hypothetical protein